MKSPVGLVRYVSSDDGEVERASARFGVEDGQLTIYDAALAGEPPVDVLAQGTWERVYVEPDT